MVKSEAEVLEIVEQYIEYVKKEIRVGKVVLFGSYAKGNPNEDSDIDIAIESPDYSDNYLEEWQRLNRFVWRSGVDLNLEPRPLHPLMDELLMKEIINTGKVLYEEPV